jgi:hypothetical protein
MIRVTWRQIFLAIVLFPSTLVGCVLSSVTPTVSPSLSAVVLTQLLIDTSVLPDGWYVCEGPGEFSEQQGQQDSVYVGFCNKTFESPTFHILLSYKDSEYASTKYRQYLPAYFNSVGRLTPWELPDALNYQSETADQFQFACANFRVLSDTSVKYTKCVAMARYEDVVSVLITYPLDGAMSYADLENILQAIDEQMSTYLKRS